MTNTTDLTTAGLIASLPAPYDTYVSGDAGEFRAHGSHMSRFIVTINKYEDFWVQDTRRGAIVLTTSNFFGAVKAMLVLNIHGQDSTDPQYDIKLAMDLAEHATRAGRSGPL